MAWIVGGLQENRPIQPDLVTGESTLLIRRYLDFHAISEPDLRELGNTDLLKQILRNSDISVSLQTLGKAYVPRVVSVGVTPTPIIPVNRYPRGYTLLNPSTTISGAVTTLTIIAAGAHAAGTLTSAAFNVSGHRTLRLILDIVGAPATLTIDVQTQDPISGNWATSQTDVFGGVVGIGTYYVSLGEFGVDQFFRVVATITGAGANFSLAGILKESIGTTIAGPTIFLGGPDVNVSLGFPLLGGQREDVYLLENTAIFGISTAITEIRVFERQ